MGGTDGCADVENIAAKGLGSKTGKNMQKSDRGSVAKSGGRTAGFEGNRRGKVAAFWPTKVVKPQEIGKKAHSNHGKREDRRGQVAAKGLKVAIRTWENGRQAQSDRSK